MNDIKRIDENIKAAMNDFMPHIHAHKTSLDLFWENYSELIAAAEKYIHELEGVKEIARQRGDAIVELQEEIERLKFIIGQLYDTERESWQQFKTENNL